MSDETQEKVINAWHQHGTILGTANAVGLSRSTVRKRLKQAGLYDERPVFAGRVNERVVESRPLPGHGEVHRYMLTSAQNNTHANQRVWDNFKALAKHYDAEVLVGSFSYNKANFGPKAVKKGTKDSHDTEDLWYDPQLEPHFADHPVELAPGLLWCGEMNILPTAVKPLQGLEVYTGRKSGIFPHVKVHMHSVASGKWEPTKFNYTTGTVTKRNYLQKKAGLKAEFHHIYGGLIVEVDHEGDWFVRQLIADDKGCIYDLDLKVEKGRVTRGHKAKSITWGDIHEATIDPVVKEVAWGRGGMLDTLKAEYQFMHDLLDFRARNGHTAKRGLIHDRFAAYVMGHDSVEDEVAGVARFLKESSRPWCKTHVVDSNHDNFMMEWLRIGDYRNDPINALYFLEAQLHVYRSIKNAPEKPVNLLRWAVERVNGERPGVRFLNEDESFVLLGIEHGLHGDRGPNGARGTQSNYARMGRRVNRGHEHSAGILDGVYTAGLSGNMDQGYNKGPSSWSHSHIVTYANGKRAIITMWNGKWRC